MGTPVHSSFKVRLHRDRSVAVSLLRRFLRPWTMKVGDGECVLQEVDPRRRIHRKMRGNDVRLELIESSANRGAGDVQPSDQAGPFRRESVDSTVIYCGVRLVGHNASETKTGVRKVRHKLGYYAARAATVTPS